MARDLQERGGGKDNCIQESLLRASTSPRLPCQTGRMDGILRPPSTAPLKGPQANTHCSCSSLFEWQPLSRVTPCALHYAVVNQKVPNTCSLPTRRFLATIVKEGSVSHRRPPAPLCVKASQLPEAHSKGLGHPPPHIAQM